MSAQMTSQAQNNSAPVVVSGEVQCALTGKTLRAEDAYWAPPLITARELITAVITNLRTPSKLGVILFEEQPNVPYDPEARQQLGARRSIDQMKLLGLLLLIAAIIVIPIFLLTI